MKALPVLASLAALATLVFANPVQAGRSSHSTSIHSPARKYSFVLVSADGTVNAWGDFSSTDLDSLRKGAKEDILYVRKDGEMFKITDRATIAQVKSDMEPINRLAKQQGDLGRQQGELGRDQGKLGAKQGEYGRKMGDLGRRMGQQSRDGGSLKDLDAQMKELSDQMKGLGKDQAALGAKQKALGTRQSELGKQMSAAFKEAEVKIDKVIDEAFAHGLAKR